MILLAMDTTEKTAAVALTDGCRLLGETTLSCGNTHTETLMPAIQSLLMQTQHTFDDIELYACSVGPGSFTGVRIGVSLVKGLAFGRNLPCIPVSALEGLAYNGLGLPGILCPVMDARRQQVYNALFRSDGGAITRLCDDRVLTISELLSELKKQYPDEPIWLFGGGAEMTFQASSKEGVTGIRMPPPPLCYENGYSVALCALRHYADNPDGAGSDRELAPLYLRSSQAEASRMGEAAEQK